MLVYQSGLILIYLGDLPAHTPSHANHIGLGAMPAQILGNIAGHMGQMMNGQGGCDHRHLCSRQRRPYQLSSEISAQDLQCIHVL